MVRMLADLKGKVRGKAYSHIALCHSTKKCHVVDARGAQVHEENVRKVRKVDRHSNGTPADQVGPMEQLFNSFGRVRGFVIGAFGEFSKDLNDFLKHLAKVGAERKWKSMGARSSKEAAQIILSHNRRVLGIEAVRSHAELLLDRLSLHIGGGGIKTAAARRKSSRNAHFSYKEAAWVHHRAGHGRHGG